MNKRLFKKAQIFSMDTLWLKFMRNLNYFLLIYSFKGSSLLRELIIKLLMPKPKGPILVSTKYGFNIICMDPIFDRGVEKPLFLYGTYEAGTLNVIKKCLSKNDVFVDVGANIGLMSIFASNIAGYNGIVYSFEPEPETFMILKKNIKINKINNIRAYNIGLGERQYKSLIFTNPYAGRGSASLIESSKQKNSKKYEVYIEKLDEFILRHNIKNIRMLKVDVEGWEYECCKRS